MSVSIDWATRIISVPQADLTPLGGSLYEMDTDWFRLQLKDLEDNYDGITNPDTHSHNTTVLLGGIEYARIIEIINGYTVTFEDGQYAVNLVGSNNNIADVTNINQVSIRPNNSAGLIQTREIQFASFQNGITVDVVNGVSGTIYPTGTVRQPVSNLSDGLFIAQLNGLSSFFVLGDMPITGGSYTGMSFVGESKSKTTITIDAAAGVLKCEFYEAHVTGTLDGDCVLKDCEVEDLTYIWGYIETCVLGGTVTLGGNQPAHFLDCYSGIPGTATPTLDCGGDGPPLAARNYNGGIKLVNKSGAAAVSIDLNSGQVILDNTVTAGEIVVRGLGKLIDTSGNHIHTGVWNGATIVNETVNLDEIAERVVTDSRVLTVPLYLGLK